MEQYIKKNDVKAEIENRRAEISNACQGYIADKKMSAEYILLNELLDFLDTLEVKEVQEVPVSVWHNANHQPTMYRKYLVRYSDGKISGSWERHDDGFIPWKDVVKEHGFTHWCYVEDLLKL